ncbi:MAG: dockerin type I domain-containing protein [bacterium]|nr:dockerin type I domain-containing protein [bacterium]
MDTRRSLILFAVVIIFLFMMVFIMDALTSQKKFTIQRRADQSGSIDLLLSADKTTVAEGENATLSIKLKSPESFASQGYVVGLHFDKNTLELKEIAYQVGNAIEGLSDTNSTLSAANGKGYIKLYAETPNGTGTIFQKDQETLIVNLRFTVKKVQKTQILVGNVVPAGAYKIQTTQELVPFSIKTSSVVINPGTDTTPTMGAAGKLAVYLKLKFQGINSRPSSEWNSLPVKLTLIDPAGQKYVSSGVFIASEQGIWNGHMDFTAPVGTAYKLYVKGGKHLQKKVCDISPTESQPASYHCEGGSITLQAGDNSFDFSHIVLLGGDLPLPEQDGIVNAYDLSAVRNNLGKKVDAGLKAMDVNMDGIIDTQDYSLIISAMSLRYDEED